MKPLMTSVLLLLVLTAAAEDSPETAIDCQNPESFKPLFELSASGTVEGADSTEELAQANEEAFLKCPYAFLLALKDQPREVQDGVVRYFGIRHAPWELGQELKKWKNHPQVGPLVRSRLAGVLNAQEPK